MSTKAKAIDFLLAGYRTSDTDVPLAAGTVTVTVAGTSTEAFVWDDRDKTLPTPTGRSTVTLDAYGRAEVYGDGIYKFVIKDSLGATVETIDYYESLSQVAIADTLATISSVEISDLILSAGPWIDVRAYDALGDDGATDAAVGIQAAIDAAASGSVILIPPASGAYHLKTTVTASGKDLVFIIQGQLNDALTSFTANFADLTLNGKGVFSVSGGDFAFIGNYAQNFYGGLSVGGVSQVGRPFFYAYNCTSVTISGMKGANLLKHAFYTVECDKVLHKDSHYTGGQFTVLHAYGGTKVVVDNVELDAPGTNGINVQNRADFDPGVLAFNRPANVTISNCRVYAPFSTNTFAVAISADSCDSVSVYGNFVDGQDAATMAYSFAGATSVKAYGNRAVNFSNVANGTYTYVGIGMEIDTVSNGEFFGNEFEEVLTAYLVLNAQNIRLNGSYVCDAAREAQKSTGAFSFASFAFIGDVVDQSQNIDISGTQDGGNLFLTADALLDGLTIHDVIQDDAFLGFARISTVSASATTTNVKIANVNIVEPGPAKRIIQTGTAATDVAMSNITARAEGTLPANNQGLLFIGGTPTNGTYKVNKCDIQNYDQVCLLQNATFCEIAIINNQFSEMRESTLLSLAGSSHLLTYENNYLDGLAIKSQGDGSLRRYGASGGTPSGTYVAGVHEYLFTDPSAGARGKVASVSGTQGTYSEGRTVSLESGQVIGTLSASSSVLRAGQFITIAGAGPASADLDTFIVYISGTSITVANAAGTTVVGAAISYFNPTLVQF